MTAKEELISYIQSFVENRHPAFQNMPVCPFARKERLEKRIYYYEYHFTSEGACETLLQDIGSFLQDQNLSSMLAYDPNYEITPRQAHQISEQINAQMGVNDCIAIPMHPDEDFEAAGIPTRKFPFFVMLIQAESELLSARAQLAQSRYYQNFSNGTVNTIAYLCTKKGAFFPNLWWFPQVIENLLTGQQLPQPILNETVQYLTPNEIHKWMFRWGKQHYWHSFCPVKPKYYEKLRNAAKTGEVIVLTFFSATQDGGIAFLTDQQPDEGPPRHLPDSQNVWEEKYISSYAWIFRPET